MKRFGTFEFTAIPSLNKMLILELARCEYVLRRENIIALGNSGTGKTHVALALGLAACQKGFTVTFTTAAALVSQLLEARDDRRLLKTQRDLAAVKLLIIDELGYTICRDSSGFACGGCGKFEITRSAMVMVQGGWALVRNAASCA